MKQKIKKNKIGKEKEKNQQKRKNKIDKIYEENVPDATIRSAR
jgi:hypothetical protein